MGPTPKVLLLMPRDGVFRAIITGFARVAATRSWIVNFAFRDAATPLSQQHIDQVVGELRPDVLVLSAIALPFVTPDACRGRTVVGCEVDLTGRGYPSVIVDNRSVGQAAARHLLEAGFRSFAAYGYAPVRFAWERTLAFRDTVTAAGGTFTGWAVPASHDGRTHVGTCGGQCRPASKLIPEQSDQWVHGVGAWLESLPKPVGVLACCDVWAQRLLWDCSMAGVRVPEDVAVVGVDDDELVCNLTHPPLSSVWIPWERLGSEVALMVRSLLDRGDPGCGVGSAAAAAAGEPVRVAAGDVVCRRSSDAAAVSDPDVAAALAFIRDNAGRPIGVPDVLAAVPCCRHRLERAFKRVLGRTLMQHVHRVHVERAKRLLATTDWPTARVAEASGLDNAVKLSVTFRKLTGMTPGEYRRQQQCTDDAATSQ